MMTYTGKLVNPFELKEDDICIEDIAHSLSMLCRFNGHCKSFYSVARHSVYVSKLVSPENAMCALLHDASEAYFGDIITPVKNFFPQIREYEDKIYKIVANKYNLPLEIPQEVHDVDKNIVYYEAKELCRWNEEYWEQVNSHKIKNINSINFFPDSHINFLIDENMFLRRFNELCE